MEFIYDTTIRYEENGFPHSPVFLGRVKYKVPLAPGIEVVFNVNGRIYGVVASVGGVEGGSTIDNLLNEDPKATIKIKTSLKPKRVQQLQELISHGEIITKSS